LKEKELGGRRLTIMLQGVPFKFRLQC